MATYEYARVSVTDQDLGVQQTALRQASCDVIRTEKPGIATLSELTVLLESLREGDTLVVTRVDRLARSIVDLHDIVRKLKSTGVRLKATEQPIDTSTAGGRDFADLVAAFAAFEINLRRDRQTEGIEAAKARGVYKGRKRSVDQKQVANLLSQGKRPTVIARELKIARSTVYEIKKTVGIEPGNGQTK